jgi:uncharacterized membrane protein
MLNSDTDSSEPNVFSVDAAKGLVWTKCGWFLYRRQLRHWLPLALIYSLLALILQLIPFAGSLILAFITPIAALGAMNTLRTRQTGQSQNGKPKAVSGFNKLLEKNVVLPAKQLFQFFIIPDRVFGAIFISMLCLGIILLIEITTHLLGGGSITTALVATQVSWLERITMFTSGILIAVLYIFVFMALIYVVPLMTIAEKLPLNAIRYSFLAFAKNFMPLTVFCLSLMVPLMITGLFPIIFGAFGLLLQMAIWPVLLPIFITGVYCSYREVYA